MRGDWMGCFKGIPGGVHFLERSSREGLGVDFCVMVGVREHPLATKVSRAAGVTLGGSSREGRLARCFTATRLPAGKRQQAARSPRRLRRGKEARGDVAGR